MSDPLSSSPLSYAAYAEIPADGQRWEFLDGEVFVTPAPSLAHQFTVLRLGLFFDAHVAHFGPGVVAFVAPLDVILSDSEIVEPDVVVARRTQFSKRGIEGAPLLLVEVVSPTRPTLDREVKWRRYAAHGVEHYWIVDPVARTAESWRLRDGRYELTATAEGTAVLEPADLPGLQLDLARLWLPDA
jgi:Uma2 family endonuclease